jgi:hypothetical protein
MGNSGQELQNLHSTRSNKLTVNSQKSSRLPEVEFRTVSKGDQ